MLNEQRISTKWIYIFGMIVFIATAWFSTGYNHFDEHFQILEFAGMKLGLIDSSALPWEYKCMMRPALQPLMVYCIYNMTSAAGVTNPFIVAFFIRLLSSILAFVSIHLIIRLYTPSISNNKLLYAFLLLSFFLWFIPYNCARFASETVAGRVFLIGLALFFLQKTPKPLHYLITGFLLGISFITRYQVAFMIIGFAAWLAVIHRAGFRKLFMFCTGILMAFGIGVLIDRWYYDTWVLTSWNYFLQNIMLGKAAGFGISPWYYYIEQTFLNAFPPLSLVCILAVFLYFIYYPKDILTWTIIPFLAAHFLIGHKEIRFIFPIIGFLPIMAIRTADAILSKRGYEILEHRATKISVKICWYLNLLMLTVLIFRPADAQISLFQTLYNDYKTPAKAYYTGENPYHRANADICFYKRKSLSFQQVASFGMIVPSRDTVQLIMTDKPELPVNEKFSVVKTYSTLPDWVRHFNVNHWVDRTDFWTVYELKKTNLQQ